MHPKLKYVGNDIPINIISKDNFFKKRKEIKNNTVSIHLISVRKLIKGVKRSFINTVYIISTESKNK